MDVNPLGMCTSEAELPAERFDYPHDIELTPVSLEAAVRGVI
jgi:hypothetical protein